MESWWPYLIIFIFGYVTCNIFYFLRLARLSLNLLKTSHIVYLSTLTKGLEYLSYSHEVMLEYMIITEKNSAQISSFKFRFDDEVQKFKDQSIEVLLKNHPKFLHSTIEFKDWPTAMKYLSDHQKMALQYWQKRND
jgi:hypothetical protein